MKVIKTKAVTRSVIGRLDLSMSPLFPPARGGMAAPANNGILMGSCPSDTRG